MTPTEKPEGDARMRLANQYEAFLRSMVLLRGDHLSGEQLGQIVERAVASASPEERRNPVPSTDAINRLQQFLIQVTEAGRPHNVFSAEAARAAQAAGGVDGLRGAGFGTFDTARAGSSARFRELAAREGSDGGKGGNPVTTSSGGVTVEFARSFASTGVVGGPHERPTTNSPSKSAGCGAGQPAPDQHSHPGPSPPFRPRPACRRWDGACVPSRSACRP